MGNHNDPMNWIEILGTFASVLVALSLTIKNIKGLRILNTFGAMVFSVYGLLIGSWPVFGLNTFIILINLYYLWVMGGETSHFQTIKITRDSDLMARFLDFYKKDIKTFNPDFQLPKEGNFLGAFILREALPIGLILLEKNSSGEWEIILDYATPAFRDLKNARYFFSQGYKILFPEGIESLYTFSRVKNHEKYLRKLGFNPVDQVGTLIKFKIPLDSRV